ncbi:MAG: hypothetical protein KIT73_10655, partial [Burkholderiales bacterium]|nr:hypothetical protein [Burkholderiales bacterium]
MNRPVGATRPHPGLPHRPTIVGKQHLVRRTPSGRQWARGDARHPQRSIEMKHVLSAVRHSLAVRVDLGRIAAYGALLGACIWTLTANEPARAEDDAMGMPDSTMAKKGNAGGKDALANELRALRKQVSDLRTAVERQQAPAKRMKPRRAGDAMAAMPKNSGSPAMGSAPAMAMDDDMDMMGAMPKGGGT